MKKINFNIKTLLLLVSLQGNLSCKPLTTPTSEAYCKYDFDGLGRIYRRAVNDIKENKPISNNLNTERVDQHILILRKYKASLGKENIEQKKIISGVISSANFVRSHVYKTQVTKAFEKAFNSQARPTLDKESSSFSYVISILEENARPSSVPNVPADFPEES